MVPELFVYVMRDGRGEGDDTRLVLGTWDVNYGHRPAPVAGDHETLSTLSPDQELTRQ